MFKKNVKCNNYLKPQINLEDLDKMLKITKKNLN